MSSTRSSRELPLFARVELQPLLGRRSRASRRSTSARQAVGRHGRRRSPGRCGRGRARAIRQRRAGGGVGRASGRGRRGGSGAWRMIGPAGGSARFRPAAAEAGDEGVAHRRNRAEQAARGAASSPTPPAARASRAIASRKGPPAAARGLAERRRRRQPLRQVGHHDVGRRAQRLPHLAGGQAALAAGAVQHQQRLVGLARPGHQLAQGRSASRMQASVGSSTRMRCCARSSSVAAQAVRRRRAHRPG